MFSKILLAVDLNDPEGATMAAKRASELAKMSDAELHLVTVVPSMGMNLVGAAFGADHTQKMLAETEAALSDWATNALSAEVAATHVSQGTVYDRILRTADKIEADAIVVGAHRPELRDYLVGPNAARVVRHAKQAVLVVR